MPPTYLVFYHDTLSLSSGKRDLAASALTYKPAAVRTVGFRLARGGCAAIESLIPLRVGISVRQPPCGGE